MEPVSAVPAPVSVSAPAPESSGPVHSAVVQATDPVRFRQRALLPPSRAPFHAGRASRRVVRVGLPSSAQAATSALPACHRRRRKDSGTGTGLLTATADQAPALFVSSRSRPAVARRRSTRSACLGPRSAVLRRSQAERAVQRRLLARSLKESGRRATPERAGSGTFTAVKVRTPRQGRTAARGRLRARPNGVPAAPGSEPVQSR